MKNHKHNSRRYFLGNLIKGGCASLSMLPALSTLTNLQLLNASISNNSLNANSTQKKALVCLMLVGGNDSFNMLVPRGSGYANYETARGGIGGPGNEGGLALVESELQPLDNTSEEFGLHPELTKIAALFNDNKASFVANVGPLAVPYDDVINGGSIDDYPLGLYSHFDQKQHWQTSMPRDRNANGWFARISEMIQDSAINSDKNFMNISVAGSNKLQFGGALHPYTIDPSIDGTGSINFTYDGGNNGPQISDNIRLNFIDSLLELNYNNFLDKALIKNFKDAKDYSGEFASMISSISQTSLDHIDNAFTSSTGKSIGEQLQMVARTLAAGFDLSHQTFYVELDGFDHHKNLLANHTVKMTDLDNAVGDFYAALENLGMANDVVLFTVSDFGRKLISNGNGSDHGWGGHQLVVGGDGTANSILNGGQIFGTYPNLATGNPDNLDMGGGRFIPTTSCDEYFADLARWFGANPADFDTIFPNLSNFNYDINTGLNLFT